MHKKHFADQNMNILDNAVGKKHCFMTADGSHGKKIKAKCLINYQVKPDISPVAETHPTPNNAIGNDVLETQNT